MLCVTGVLRTCVNGGVSQHAPPASFRVTCIAYTRGLPRWGMTVRTLKQQLQMRYAEAGVVGDWLKYVPAIYSFYSEGLQSDLMRV